MGWRHPADDLSAAHAHQPHTVFLPVGDEDVPESVVRRRDTTAVRAACSCRWRGPRLAITQQGSQHRGPGPAEVDREVETLQRRRLQGQWEAHLREVVPTLGLHLHMPHVRYLDAELAAAVAHARHHEASWAVIAAACSRPEGAHRAGVVMSRQAAQQRWGPSTAGLDGPGERARLPVVTAWPGLPGWSHPAAGLDSAAAAAHQPQTVWVQPRGGEASNRTRASTALRPGCGCGWRGSPRPVPDEPPSRMADAVGVIERGFGPEWGRHLYTTVATLRIREVLDLMAGVHADLDAAVAAARNRGASWQDIADVVGTRRQSAHQRWRHLDTTPGPAAAAQTSPDPTADTDPDPTADTAIAAGKPPRSQVRKVPPLLRSR